MKKVAFLLLCSLLTGGLLSACGSNTNSAEPEAPEQPVAATTAAEASNTEAADEKETETAAEQTGERTVTDELGNEVVIPATPQKIVAPYLEDSLLKLGVKPVFQWSNGNQAHEYLQEELKDIPKVDFSGGLPSPEVLMAYEPDLIILHTASYAGDGIYENYSKVAPTFVFSNASGDVEKSLTTLGELLNKSAEAEQAIEAYNAKVEEAKGKLKDTVGDKKVAIIRFAAKGISMMGGNYFCGYVLYEDLGISRPKLVETENSANVSMEILPEIHADYIFIINAYGQGTEAIKEMKESSVWNSMPAVKAGQVYEVNAEHWLGGGLIAYEKIIDDTLELLAK